MDLRLADWHSWEICGITICGLIIKTLRIYDLLTGTPKTFLRICNLWTQNLFSVPTFDTYKTSERFYFKFKSNLRRKMYMLHSVQRNVVLVIEKSRLWMCTHTKLLEYWGYIQRETLAMEPYARANYNLTLFHSRLQCSAFHPTTVRSKRGGVGKALLLVGHIYAFLLSPKQVFYAKWEKREYKKRGWSCESWLYVL